MRTIEYVCDECGTAAIRDWSTGHHKLPRGWRAFVSKPYYRDPGTVEATKGDTLITCGPGCRKAIDPNGRGKWTTFG